MSEHPQGAQPPIDHEIAAGAIGKVGAWLAVVTVAGFVVGWGFYLYLSRAERALDAPPSPIAEARSPRLPSGPALQATPERDLAALRQAEETVLHGWAWVDREANLARVPVAKAIDRVAADGALPDFSQPLEISTP
ncbi:MAG: hypothetical protein NDJ75_05290 [Thermoanaerobaculia bacterium]|nr:hypothetical protein [Thermoanaerobaculia bacterium]